jgi:iron(III) transport system substrate-binding protein
VRIFAIAAAVAMMFPAPIMAEQSPDIVSAAKTEGTVVWYSALDAATLNGVVQLFNDSHPGIVLKALQIGSSVIPARVMTEQAAHYFNADIVSCDQFGFTQLSDSKLFKPFKPSEHEYAPGMLDPKGIWATLYTDTMVLAWNPDRLKAAGLRPPRSLAELAQPQWKGRIGIDGTAFNWYQGVLATQKNANTVLAKIADNKALITSGHSATITQLENGEFDVSPTAYGYMAERARLAGRPIDFLSPDPVTVGLEQIGIMKTAPHPNAARVLADWLIGKKAQQFFADDGRTPARTDVKSDKRVFDAKMPFYILPAPQRGEYNDLVSHFKALLGITI